MLIAHYHYFNDTSGTKSRVYITHDREDAIRRLRESLKISLTGTEYVDNSNMFYDLMKDKGDDENENADLEDDFNIRYNQSRFNIENENGEYFSGQIMDCELGTESIL